MINELIDDITYFTGGEYTPSEMNYRWKKLADRIEKEGASPGQFCWFCVHKLNGGKEGAGVFTKANLVTSDKTFDKFRSYRKERERYLKDECAYQIESFLREKKRVSGELILQDKRRPISPVMKSFLVRQEFPDGGGIEVDKELVEYEKRGRPELLEFIRKGELVKLYNEILKKLENEDGN